MGVKKGYVRTDRLCPVGQKIGLFEQTPLYTCMTRTPDNNLASTVDLHHVGCFVEDIQQSISFYQYLFGAEILYETGVDSVGEEKTEKTSVSFLRIPTLDYEIHLINRGSRNADHEVLDMLEPYRYHLAYEVDDVRTAIRRVQEAGGATLHSDPVREDLRPWERTWTIPGKTPGPPFEMLELIDKEPSQFR